MQVAGSVRKILRLVTLGIAVVALAALAAGGLFSLEILSREPPLPVPSTTHATIARRECIDCHEPIAEEWRQSFHYLSLTGPYWKDVRDLGYVDVFELTRKACVNCHAPANVLDLESASEATGSLDGGFGVECTPNLLREPRGVIPAARAEDVELGVDCTSCHVGRKGIAGSGRRTTTAHEVTADDRFRDPRTASMRLCRACHGSAVRAWERSAFASRGVTCLDCHMPLTTAPSTAGGPPRTRRSHRFLGDKDPATLESAVHLSMEITEDRRAMLRIANDRVGHFFPSGGNWVSVQIRVYDAAGSIAREQVEVFGKEEPLLLDFWPFNLDRRIAAGEDREIAIPLPEGHGSVTAVVRYHDWMKTKTTVTSLERSF